MVRCPASIFSADYRASSMAETEVLRVGIVTVSDRASTGTYRDASGPAIEEFLREVVTTSWRALARLVPDGIDSVRDVLVELADREKCDLIFTTGGTGPAPRDLTPEAAQVAPDAGLRRAYALGAPETGADRDPVAADCRHPRQDADRQSARPAKLDPLYDAGAIPGKPLLPRPDRGGPHRHRRHKMQSVPAAAIT